MKKIPGPVLCRLQTVSEKIVRHCLKDTGAIFSEGFGCRADRLFVRIFLR